MPLQARLSHAERQRRAWCRQKAVFLFYQLENGKRTFEQILNRIQRRWPVAARESCFRDHLQFLYDQERAANIAWELEQTDTGTLAGKGEVAYEASQFGGSRQP